LLRYVITTSIDITPDTVDTLLIIYLYFGELHIFITPPMRPLPPLIFSPLTAAADSYYAAMRQRYARCAYIIIIDYIYISTMYIIYITPLMPLLMPLILRHLEMPYTLLS